MKIDKVEPGFKGRVLMLLRRVKFNIVLNGIFELKALLRQIGIGEKQYRNIKKFKDKHLGERCFIIATGPSLTMEDLEKLKNEYTFSMNSMCLALDKTDFRPTYYGIQDENVYSKLKDQLEVANLETIFVSSELVKKHQIDNRWIVFPHNDYYHNIDWRFYDSYHSKFSGDCYKVVYDGYSITYSLLQIAVYMGFKEIYLLGADCNYPKQGAHHFIEHGHYDPTAEKAGERMMAAYKDAHIYAKSHGIKIYNATRGGMLEEFERVDLDQIISVPRK